MGSVLPSAQALPEHGTNPTFVEIGIASLGGQATANSGLDGHNTLSHDSRVFRHGQFSWYAQNSVEADALRP